MQSLTDSHLRYVREKPIAIAIEVPDPKINTSECTFYEVFSEINATWLATLSVNHVRTSKE